MTFTVTQEHIDRGIRSSCTSCPIALAACVSDLDVRGASVSPGVILVLFESHHPSRSYALPLVAGQWMDAYDAGKTVHPFTFDAEER